MVDLRRLSRNGNSLTLTIPPAVRRELKLVAGALLMVSLRDGCIVARPWDEAELAAMQWGDREAAKAKLRRRR